MVKRTTHHPRLANIVLCLYVLLIAVWLIRGLLILIFHDTLGESIITLTWTFHGLLILIAFNIIRFILKDNTHKRIWLSCSLSLPITWVLFLGINLYISKIDDHRLDQIYHQLADAGPPFPEQLNPNQYQFPIRAHWYYQCNSETQFSIVHTIDSNSFIKQYPNPDWQHFGFKPFEYDPTDIRE